MSYYLSKANDGKHKFLVITPKGKKIKFGAIGYSDYTMHKDKERLKRYLARHKNNENWQNINTAGFWARWLLWSQDSLKKAINYTEKKFNINIVIKV